MRYVERGGEPSFWADIRKAHSGLRYNGLDNVEGGAEARARLREFLVGQQRGLCAYCCKGITADPASSLNEHIAPQSKHPNATMDFGNLVATCTSSKHCGHYKKEQYDERLFVSPLEPDCAEHFSFLSDGSIRGVDERGRYTRDLLNLDAYELRNARRATLAQLEPFDEDARMEYIRFLVEDDPNRLPAFYDMIEQVYGVPPVE